MASEAVGSISRIEAFHYRSLRQVSQTLRPFQVLLGSNGSGKSTLIDALAFLCDLQRVSVEGAVYGDDRQDIPARARKPCHLTWMHDGGRFELALEARIPAELREEIDGRPRDTCRYAVAIDTSGPPRLIAETLSVGDRGGESPDAATSLPLLAGPDGRVPKPDPQGWLRLLLDGENQLSNWKSLVGPSGPPKSVVHWSGDGKRTSLPYYGPDSGYQLLTWFLGLIAPLQRICLSGEALRRPNALRAADELGRDGGNFANFLHGFRRKSPDHPEELLTVFRSDAEHALVMLDHSWNGVPADSAESLERMIENRFEALNLAPWAVPVVIYPELESWVWSPSPHVDDALGWRGRSPSLRDALHAQGLWPPEATKPPDPKAAVEWAARQAGLPRSSSIYRQIARRDRSPVT